MTQQMIAPQAKQRSRETLLQVAAKSPAKWSVAAAILVWLVTVLYAQRGYGTTLVSAAIVAVFLVLAGLGQMFVITSGNGNIDLSISYVMTFSGFLAVKVMDADNSRILLALVTAALVGVLAGLLNFGAIRALGIPPIVATLAIGFLLFSMCQRMAHSGSHNPAPALVDFTNARVASIPISVCVTVVLSVLAAVVLHLTRFGRSLEAIGQNRMATWLAGIKVDLITCAAYVLSGMFAAFAGLLLAAYSNGAALDLASTYQLGSIAVVVLGGSLIAGGRSTVVGVWGAAMFVTLTVTMLNVFKLTAAWQFIIQGLLIVAVLALAGQRRAAR